VTAGASTVPTGLSESIPDGIVTHRDLKVFGGVEVARHRFRPGEMQVAPLDGPALTMHLSGPNRLVHRPEDDGAWEGVEFRGDANVYRAGVPFEEVFDSESEDLNVLLGRSFFRRVAEGAGADPDRLEVLDRFGLRDPKIERLLLAFLEELDTGGLGGELYAQGLAQALAVHLLREHSSLGERARRSVERGPNGRLSRRQLKAAVDHVGDNLSGELSLEAMARQANLSVRHFHRLFREATGMSPHRYVIWMRVERAKDLLRGTDLPVGEVARLCGFSNQSHLALHVKRLLGVSPSDFRRRRDPPASTHDGPRQDGSRENVAGSCSISAGS